MKVLSSAGVPPIAVPFRTAAPVSPGSEEVFFVSKVIVARLSPAAVILAEQTSPQKRLLAKNAR